MIRIFCLLFVLAVNVVDAGTYYIDYATGSDANNGTAKATPWKRMPGMSGFSGTYTHSAGDRFIFKGGVTWPGSAFPTAFNGIEITAGGSSNSNRDYYGVDSTWYSGGSWARPIWNLGGNTYARHTLVRLSNASYVTFDNIEITGFYWNAASGGYGTAIFLTYQSSYINFTNIKFHNWSHSVGGLSWDYLKVITNSSSGGHIVDGCIFDGAPNGTDSGQAVHGYSGTIRNTIARNLSNGFILSGSTTVENCDIGPINYSWTHFDPDGQHENSIESLYQGNYVIRNNRIHSPKSVCLLIWTDLPYTYQIYNNLFYDTGGVIPIQLDGRGTTGSVNAQIYNNSFVIPGGVSVRNEGLGTPWTLTARNNHVIGGSLASGTVGIQSNNLIQTTAQATAGGYTQSTLWAPASGSAPTVNTGTSNVGGLFTDDLLHVPRPLGGAWDIGAYEYGGVPASTPTPPPTPPPSPTPSGTPTPPLGLSFGATDGSITTPFTVSGSHISQTIQTTDPTQGGRASYTFAVPIAGDYLLSATVNCLDEATNSLFVNIDAEPSSAMIWDISPTSGFELRIASWPPSTTPKAWTLTAGTHQLIFRGREANAILQHITLGIAPLAPQGLRVP